MSARTALWPHQRDAVAAAVKTLTTRTRTTVVAACGSGKTRIGAETARRLLPPDGRLLIIAPTLELIAQILQEHRRALGAVKVGTVIAVCSDHAAIYQSQVDLSAEHAAVTTDAAQLVRLLAAPGRATVACTYASLAVLREAHELGLARWDLAIVDEAHRSAGRAGKPWAVIHDDAAIPCARRLYMTATPRLLGDPDADDEGRDELVGMDDEAVFGPVCYQLTFADAIRRGLLADYRVLVPVITDGEIHRHIDSAPDQPLYASGALTVSPQTLAVQVALLRAAAQHGLRRIITYHHTVAAAKAFATTLHTAAQMLPLAERPERLIAKHVSGAQAPSTRRPILANLASSDPDVTVVVGNARVLSEGVDVPAVDAVMFVDPRDSAETTIQAVGRALRTGGQPDKIATVVVPVLLAPDETPETALAGSAWSAVWRTVRALRAHDERLGTSLDQFRYELGRSLYEPRSTPNLPQWIGLSGIPVPDGFASAVSVRMVRMASPSHREMLGRAAAFRQRNGHLLPSPRQDADLMHWLERQRYLRSKSELSDQRIRQLDELGMVWSVSDHQWAQMHQLARSYHAKHGNLEIPFDATWGDPPQKLGAWLVAQRQRRRQGRLSAQREAALDALGIDWDPSETLWNAGLAAARSFHAAHGHLAMGTLRTWGDPPYSLGTWLALQRKNREAGTLSAERIAALDELGIMWKPQRDRWERGLAAASAYRDAHGDLLAPTDAVIDLDGEPYKIGSWLGVQRNYRRKGKLSAERIERLDAIGMIWEPAAHRWQQALTIARDYHATHGQLRVDQDVVWGDPPFNLGHWLIYARDQHAKGLLEADQIAALDTLDMPWSTSSTAPAPRRAGRPAGQPRASRAAASHRISGDTDEERWIFKLDQLCEYQAEHHGALPTSATSAAMPGNPSSDLYAFLAEQRRRLRQGTLTAREIALLDTLGPRWSGRRRG